MDGNFDNIIAEVKAQNDGNLEPVIINHDPHQYDKSSSPATDTTDSSDGTDVSVEGNGEAEADALAAKVERARVRAERQLACKRYTEALTRAEARNHVHTARELRRYLSHSLDDDDAWQGRSFAFLGGQKRRMGAGAQDPGMVVFGDLRQRFNKALAKADNWVEGLVEEIDDQLNKTDDQPAEEAIPDQTLAYL